MQYRKIQDIVIGSTFSNLYEMRTMASQAVTDCIVLETSTECPPGVAARNFFSLVSEGIGEHGAASDPLVSKALAEIKQPRLTRLFYERHVHLKSMTNLDEDVQSAEGLIKRVWINGGGGTGTGAAYPVLQALSDAHRQAGEWPLALVFVLGAIANEHSAGDPLRAFANQAYLLNQLISFTANHPNVHVILVDGDEFARERTAAEAVHFGTLLENASHGQDLMRQLIDGLTRHPGAERSVNVLCGATLRVWECTQEERIFRCAAKVAQSLLANTPMELKQPDAEVVVDVCFEKVKRELSVSIGASATADAARRTAKELLEGRAQTVRQNAGESMSVTREVEWRRATAIQVGDVADRIEALCAKSKEYGSNALAALEQKMAIVNGNAPVTIDLDSKRSKQAFARELARAFRDLQEDMNRDADHWEQLTDCLSDAAEALERDAIRFAGARPNLQQGAKRRHLQVAATFDRADQGVQRRVERVLRDELLPKWRDRECLLSATSILTEILETTRAAAGSAPNLEDTVNRSGLGQERLTEMVMQASQPSDVFGDRFLDHHNGREQRIMCTPPGRTSGFQTTAHPYRALIGEEDCLRGYTLQFAVPLDCIKSYARGLGGPLASAI